MSQYIPVKEQKEVKMFDGIVRKTLCYDEQNMLCHFSFKKGAKIPLHNHVAVQNGYVIKGKVRFLSKEGEDVIVEAGDGYFFESNEIHGAETLEDAELVECFSPCRAEYIPEDDI